MPHVLSSTGTSWVVRRRLLPWRIRNRVPVDLAPLVLLPLSGLLMALEAVAALLVHPVLRLTGRPWTVEAETAVPPTRLVRWSVRGRGTARAHGRAVITALESGAPLPEGGTDA